MGNDSRRNSPNGSSEEIIAVPVAPEANAPAPATIPPALDVRMGSRENTDTSPSNHSARSARQARSAMGSTNDLAAWGSLPGTPQPETPQSSKARRALLSLQDSRRGSLTLGKRPSFAGWGGVTLDDANADSLNASLRDPAATPTPPEGHVLVVTSGDEPATKGHNKKHIVRREEDGKKFYAKTTVVEDSSGLVRRSECFLSKELFYHTVQRELLPESVEPLEFDSFGDIYFMLERRPDACNLKQFLDKIISGEITEDELAAGLSDGVLLGLASAIALKERLIDSDNKLENYVVFKNSMGKFVVYGIDGEKLLMWDRYASPADINSNTASLVSCIKDASENEEYFRKLKEMVNCNEVDILDAKISSMRGFILTVAEEALKVSDPNALHNLCEEFGVETSANRTPKSSSGSGRSHVESLSMRGEATITPTSHADRVVVNNTTASLGL